VWEHLHGEGLADLQHAGHAVHTAVHLVHHLIEGAHHVAKQILGNAELAPLTAEQFEAAAQRVHQLMVELGEEDAPTLDEVRKVMEGAVKHE
jgi:biotin carboxylase